MSTAMESKLALAMLGLALGSSGAVGAWILAAEEKKEAGVRVAMATSSKPVFDTWASG